VRQYNKPKWQNTDKESTAKEENPSGTLVAISGRTMASRATAVGMNNDIYQIFPQPKDPDQTMRLARKG